jgi:hypothetical protein
MYLSSNDRAGLDRPTSVSDTVGLTRMRSFECWGRPILPTTGSDSPSWIRSGGNGSGVRATALKERGPDGAQVAAEAMPYHT